MVFAELVDAAGVDGSPQEFIDLILGVHGLLDAPAAGGGEEVESPVGGREENREWGPTTASASTTSSFTRVLTHVKLLVGPMPHINWSYSPAHFWVSPHVTHLI